MAKLEDGLNAAKRFGKTFVDYSISAALVISLIPVALVTSPAWVPIVAYAYKEHRDYINGEEHQRHLREMGENRPKSFKEIRFICFPASIADAAKRYELVHPEMFSKE